MAAAFAVLAAAATWPVITDPAHLSVSPPTETDYRLLNYLIAWGAHALITDPLSLHRTTMFHPEPYPFVYTDMPVAQSLMMLPVIRAWGNPVLTYNLLLLLGLVIGGTGFFVLARSMTGSGAAAFTGAVLWVFNPVHFTRYQQIQLIGDHWLPWMTWALLRWLRPGDERGPASVKWAMLAATFFCLNALSGAHLAAFGALVAASAVLWFALAGGYGRRGALWRGLLAFGLLSLLVLGPVFWPYLLLEDDLAEQRAETLDLANASLRPFEAFSARSHFYVWLNRTVGWPGVLNRSDRELRGYGFPGVVTLLLAAIGIFSGAAGARALRSFWLFATLLFVFLAMGSYGGYALVGDLPPLRLIRVPTRFLLPAVFGLAMLATLGAATILRRVPRRAGAAALAALLLLFAAEASFAPLRTWPYEHESRPLNDFLAGQPGDFAVVEIPVSPFAYAINMRQVAHSAYHWKRVLVGYSGYQSQENIDLLRRVRDGFPSSACLDELVALNVRFAVVLTDRVSPELLDAVAAQPRLELTWQQDTWYVYRVRAR